MYYIPSMFPTLRTCHTNTLRQSMHVYSRLRLLGLVRHGLPLSWPWSTSTSTQVHWTSSLQFHKDAERAVEGSKSFTSILQSNIIFQDDNIIAFNKPQGLSVFGSNSRKTFDEESVVTLLPTLSQRVDAEELNIGLSLKSYYSGVVLLTKNQSSAEKLQKSLLHATSKKRPFLTYLAILVGNPQCEVGKAKEMYLESRYLHGRELTIVTDKSILSARKEGKMIQTVFSVKIISSNRSTLSSLVEIKISKDKLDAIPALLSHYLSPILGDNVYSSRTAYLMGVPFPSPPHVASPGVQRLPVSTENALWDHFKLDNSPLPLFLHRHRVTLLNFPSRSSAPYKVSAPPPPYFTTALDCLGLQMVDAR